jgi:hypothetical protein
MLPPVVIETKKDEIVIKIGEIKQNRSRGDPEQPKWGQVLKRIIKVFDKIWGLFF